MGNEYSAALGIVCGNAEKGLCVLEHVDGDAVRAAREMVNAGKIKVEIDSISSELFIRTTVHTAHDLCVTELRGSHTNFCRIEQNGKTIISRDPRMSCKILSCAAAEARVLGIDKAAMSITGSGTHGIICTLPLAAYCKGKEIDEERLLRATAISYLVCMYMKEFSGKEFFYVFKRIKGYCT